MLDILICLYYISFSEQYTEHLEGGGEKIARLKVHRVFDEFLLDPNISLRTKGFLTKVLTNNITTGFEVEKYCSDTKEDIKDALLN